MADELTIAKIVDGLPRLRINDERLQTYENTHPFKPSIPPVDKNTYLGIEVEVENVRNWENTNPYWSMTDDGSLRNSGKEFITPPIRAWRVEHALHRLREDLNSDIEFTERTSVHIHMNVRTLTMRQLEALTLTYMVFEKTLFRYVGNERYNNIFCVPLCETSLGWDVVDLLEENVIPHWMKYTAMNLLPIREKGTVEFRHMYGTLDKTILMHWINLLLCLKVFALRNPPEYIKNKILNLNTTSEYRIFGEEVFGTQIQDIFDEAFSSDVGACVSYIKSMCFGNSFETEIYDNMEEESNLLMLYNKSIERAQPQRPTFNFQLPRQYGTGGGSAPTNFWGDELEQEEQEEEEHFPEEGEEEFIEDEREARADRTVYNQLRYTAGLSNVTRPPSTTEMRLQALARQLSDDMNEVSLQPMRR